MVGGPDAGADRLLGEQVADGVDDRGHRLVLGEGPDRAGDDGEPGPLGRACRVGGQALGRVAPNARTRSRNSRLRTRCG